MKLIKEGKIKPIAEEIRKTCFTCKAIFSYNQSDTQIDRDGKYVKCPSCNSFIAVS